MPELPDIEAYLAALRLRCEGRPLVDARVFSLFLLRTAEPPLSECLGKTVVALSRLGKRVVFHLEGDLYLVLHLMIAGRLAWTDKPAARPSGKLLLAEFTFPTGILRLTEAGTRKRASLHVVRGSDSLRALDPGGVEPLGCTFEEFDQALRAENRTLKRALTNPRRLSGIGNAFSDEILFAARLSPVRLTSALGQDESKRLFEAVREVLNLWKERLIQRAQTGFPKPADVTAFRPEFAVHGKYGRPCPVCASPVQRIQYEENETNYCARCQNEGRLLADRALSRLLKSDWPRTLDELES